MALDPSIGLGFKPATPFDPMGAAKQGMQLAQMGQQIEESKAQVETLAAARPGVAADAAGKVREQEFNKFLKDNADSFYDTDPATGVKTFNAGKAADVAGKAGFLDKARSGLASDLSNQSTDILNTQGRIKSDQDMLIFQDKKKKALEDSIGYISNVIDNTPDKDKEAQAKVLIGGVDSLFKGQGFGEHATSRLYTDTPVKDAAGNVVYKKDGSGNVVMDKDNQPVPLTTKTLNIDAIKAHKQATIDAATQTNQAMAKQTLAATLERYGQSPEAYQTGSTLSTMARASLRKQGIEVPDTMNYRDMMQLYGEKLSELATNDVVSREYKQDIKTRIGEAANDVNKINLVMKSAEAYGKPLLGTKLGKIGTDLWNKNVADNKQLSGLITGIQLYNERFKSDPIDTANLTVSQILEKLNSWKAMRLTDLNTHVGQQGPNVNTSVAAQGPDVPQVATPDGMPSKGAGVVRQEQPTQPKAITRQDGKVLMLSPDNKKHWVSASEVNDAINHKWSLAK